MTKQKLIEFIVKKGNAIKHDQTDLTRALTQDKENLEKLIPTTRNSYDEKKKVISDVIPKWDNITNI